MDWGQGSGKAVPVCAEHRCVVIITTVIIATLHGSAAWPSRGGDGDDRAGGAEGLGPGEGSAGRRERPPPRMAEGLASCLAGPGQPVDRWGLSAARRETLASGWHRGQIRP